MRRTTLLVTSSLLLVLLVLAGVVYSRIRLVDMTDQDIRYSFIEGQRLIKGQNPYARVLEGDLVTNDKYATYFPVFYELSFVSEKLGLTGFGSWLGFWRPVFLIFDLAIGILLYWAFVRRNLPWVGLFAAAFWLFNRWTLQLLRVANLDFIPIFFLLLSLELFPRNKWLALFFFSLSLGVKQIAVFIAPLYLIWLWQTSHGNRLRDVALGTAIIASVPFVSSIPFLVWNIRGFIHSVLFSVTRAASQASGLAPAVGAYAGGNPELSRVLMLCLMLALLIFSWHTRGARYVFAFLVMLVFVYFNPVLYVQYILWTVPLGVLLLCDVRDLLSAQSVASST